MTAVEVVVGLYVAEIVVGLVCLAVALVIALVHGALVWREEAKRRRKAWGNKL